MDDEDVGEFFARWAEAGQDLRETWLAEMREAGRRGQWDDLSYLLAMDDISSESRDLIAAIMDVGQWWKDAPRRHAQKKRRKTQKPGVSWQRELVEHLRREGPETRKAKVRSLPLEHEEPLRLGSGREVHLDRDGRIVCTDTRRVTASIAIATFERYLKEKSKKQ
mgnify:CR=1 FL=1